MDRAGGIWERINVDLKGTDLTADVSPDGRFLAIDGHNEETGFDIWIVPLNGEGEPYAFNPIRGAQRNARFSPDGKRIAYDGADKRPLASLGGNNGATWNADGDIAIATGERELQILRAGDASLEPLTTLNAERFENAHSGPHFLPDGNRYLYLALTFDPDQEIRLRTLYAGNLATGEQTLIGPFSSNAWYVEPGYLVYVEDGTVKAVRFDDERLRLIGEPRILAQEASYFKPTGRAAISASRDGVVVFARKIAPHEPVWFDAKGNRLGPIKTPALLMEDHRISPDGRIVAAGFADPRTRLPDIMLLGLDRETSRKLTFEAHWEGNPVWSRDGKTIYYSSDRHGWPDIFSIPVAGGEPEVVLREDGDWFPTDVSADGRFLAVAGPKKGAATGFDIWMIPLDGESEPFAFNPTRGRQTKARFSPNGNRIAYESRENRAMEVFVDTFPDPAGGIQISLHGGFSPVWSSDGKKLYYGRRPSGDRDWAVMVVEFTDSETQAITEPEVVFEPGAFEGFDMAPDDEQFLLRLVADARPDNHVIMNWMSLFDTERGE